MIHRVRAVNEPGSSNLVHDDEFARRLGFRGGLVPGVDVYAYMAELPARQYGDPWLCGGTFSARFLKPVYDGEDVTVTASPRDGGLDLELHNPDGQLCATGRAEPSSSEPAPARERYREAPLPEVLPVPAFSPGQVLGSLHVELEIRDHAWPARLANAILMANVQLPPWMHVESRTRHVDRAQRGRRVSVYGDVAGAWERRGHRFVDLDVLVTDELERPLAQIRHIAIYELAQLRGRPESS